MANPPSPTGFTPTTPDAPLQFGTLVHYGLNDLTVVGILIDSYKRDAKYAKMDEVVGENGIVEGIRMSDYRVELSVSGRLLDADTFVLEVGDTLTINGDSGLITAISMSASGTGFTTADITATAYEGVAGFAPAA
jgi:hypothetical protein